MVSIVQDRHFVLREHDSRGVWESNDDRYRDYAHRLLSQLEAISSQVVAKWPTQPGQSLTSNEGNAEAWELARVSDRTSDMTRIFAALAVEGFLNFYGAFRMGQYAFDEYFERSGVVPRLRKLLLVCDNLNLPNNDPLCICMEKVAQSRNSLDHPNAKEVGGDPAKHQRRSTKVPDVARECVNNMERFF